MKNHFDAVLIQKQPEDGLKVEEAIGLFNLLGKDVAAFPIEIEGCYNSVALGYISENASELLGSDLPRFQTEIRSILDDTSCEHKDNIYSISGLNVFLGYEVQVPTISIYVVTELYDSSDYYGDVKVIGAFMSQQEAGAAVQAQYNACMEKIRENGNPFYEGEEPWCENGNAQIVLGDEESVTRYVWSTTKLLLPQQEADSSQSNIQPDQALSLAENFLNSSTDAYAIFQLKLDESTTELRFMDSNWLQKKGLKPNKGNYDLVYTGRLYPSENRIVTLEHLYCTFNTDHPKDFHGHSLSVSDVVALKENGIVTYYYVDSVGYKELPNFDTKAEYSLDEGIQHYNRVAEARRLIHAAIDCGVLTPAGKYRVYVAVDNDGDVYHVPVTIEDAAEDLVKQGAVDLLRNAVEEAV